MSLPKGVHKVTSRGREYFYFQEGRNTADAKPRVKLPSDPHSPEFWQAIRALKGERPEPVVVTMSVVFDKYIEWLKLSEKTTAETKRKYERQLDLVRPSIGHARATEFRTEHTHQLLDKFAAVPGTANNILGALRALSKWAVQRGHFGQSIAHGIEPNRSDNGHRPWTKEQCLAAERSFTGMVRRAYFLARYTGLRGSDVVRLHPGMVDDGGFRLTPQKTRRRGLEVWSPIDDSLAAEMATWGKELGPYLKQNWGKVYGRKLLTKQFADAVAEIAELAGVTFHGLRGTRVVELRQRGATSLQIADQVGMSLGMIERYCKFSDKKANGKAAVLSLRRVR